MLSRCPEFISKAGRTTARGDVTLLKKKQSLEIQATDSDDEDCDIINIGAMEVELLLPEAKEMTVEKAMLDDDYGNAYKQVSTGKISDKEYSIQDGILCWKNRVYAPKGLRSSIIQSEHDFKVAGHFRRDRTIEHTTRNFYGPNMEADIRKYCNKCDNCQQTKSPRHAKHGLLHPVELASELWTHISMGYVTDLLESEKATMIEVVVDRCMKMAQFIPVGKKD